MQQLFIQIKGAAMSYVQNQMNAKKSNIAIRMIDNYIVHDLVPKPGVLHQIKNLSTKVV